jgi:hypothetical protein
VDNHENVRETALWGHNRRRAVSPAFSLATTLLEKYEIDFVVLEKNEEIATQFGVSISLLPTDERILDQLGC